MGNFYFPPWHIKLGLMKQFVKAMDTAGDGFNFLKTKFPYFSKAKIKEGIFVSSQITERLNLKENQTCLHSEARV